MTSDMKPSQFLERAYKRLETLETEKIKRIHEIWKIESEIESIKNTLDAAGFTRLDTFSTKNNEKKSPLKI